MKKFIEPVASEPLRSSETMREMAREIAEVLPAEEEQESAEQTRCPWQLLFAPYYSEPLVTFALFDGLFVITVVSVVCSVRNDQRK